MLPLLRCLSLPWPAVQVHAVGDRLAAVTRLLEARGFAVHAEQQTGLDGNFLVYAWKVEDGM